MRCHPAAAGAARFGGLNRHEWGGVHFWLSVGVVTLLAVHLALHWQWVCVMFSRLFHRANAAAPLSPRRRSAGGLALLLTIVAAGAFFLWLAQTSVMETARPGRGLGGGSGHEHTANERPSATIVSRSTLPTNTRISP